MKFDAVRTGYETPTFDCCLLETICPLADSGMSSSPFDDGGGLPLWDGDGVSTSPFEDGGIIPE